jgi:hypothetical protein
MIPEKQHLNDLSRASKLETEVRCSCRNEVER